MIRISPLLTAALLAATAALAAGQDGSSEPENGSTPLTTGRRIGESETPVTPAPVSPAVFHKNLARWNAMSEADRQKLREKFARLKSMPPEDRTVLAENTQRFLALPAEKQKEMAALVGALTPEERKAAQQAIHRIRQAKILPEGIPAALLVRWVGRQPEGAIDRLRQMTPEERKAEFQRIQKDLRLFVLEQIRAKMPPEERAAFEALTPEERMQKARKLIREAWETRKPRPAGTRPVGDGTAPAPEGTKPPEEAPK